VTAPPASSGAPAAAPELHEGFRDPGRVPATDLERFLEEADRLTGIREIQRAMRRAIEPGAGKQVLDAGCGIGLETTRLAAAHPQMRVTGVDRNGAVLDAVVRLLCPGGRRALFELDYGAAILAPGPSGDAAASDAVEVLRASIPQPLAWRRIPGLLTARGLGEVIGTPFTGVLTTATKR